MAQLIKTVGGLAIASVKTINGLAIASVKTIGDVDNTSAGGSDPEFGAISDYYESGTNTITSAQVTLANVAIGDLVLAFVQRAFSATLTGVTCAGQAMARCALSDSGNDDFYFEIWGVIANANTASATIQATWTADNQYASLSAGRWTNVGSATPLTTSCNAAGCVGIASSATTRTAQQITTESRALIIGAGTNWNGGTTQAGANGFTAREGSTGVIQFVYDKVADAGNFGGAANFGTAGAADQYLSLLLAFSIA